MKRYFRAEKLADVLASKAENRSEVEAVPRSFTNLAAGTFLERDVVVGDFSRLRVVVMTGGGALIEAGGRA